MTGSRVYHNPITHQVWITGPGGQTRMLGTAGSRQALGRLMADHRLIRTGDWIKAYGPVRSATVWTEAPA